MVIKKLVNNKHIRDFSKYIAIGAIFTILNIFFMWLLIDVFGLYSAIGAAIVVVVLFFGKFYAYILIKLLHKKFLGYASVNLISMILNVVFVWIFIEIFHIPTIYSSGMVVLVLFIGRFFAFKKLRLIRE